MTVIGIGMMMVIMMVATKPLTDLFSTVLSLS